MIEHDTEQPKTFVSSWSQFRSLRWHLVLRTLVPLGLLVLTFAIVGQIGYTQVSESLARNRDTELSKIETARVGDYLLEAVQSFRQATQSPTLLWGSNTQLVSLLRDETLSQHFDSLIVSDENGNVKASSDGYAGGTLMDPTALDYLKGEGLPMTFAPGKMADGRKAIVISMRYQDSSGNLAGIVQGAIAYGSQKLAAPLQDISASIYQSGSSGSPSSGFSYLMTADRVILWHPDPVKVGTQGTIIAGSTDLPTEPGAQIVNDNGTRYIVGYSPLNLGQLLTQVSPYRPWIRLYVVTEHRWSDVVAPLNTLLYLLAILALSMFLLALMVLARSANRLTVPVAKLVNAAQALSAGKLQHRLDLLEIKGPTEIEELAKQFNNMAEQLQSSYVSLEEKVEDRTAELATANVELARRLRESQTMQEVAGKVAGTAGLNEILDAVVTSAMQVLETEGSVVYLPSAQDPDKLEAVMVKNVPQLNLGTTLDIASTLTGTAFRTGKPQLSAHSEFDSRVDSRLVKAAKVRSMLIVPLITSGQVIGVISTMNKIGGPFNDDDVRLLTLFANQAAVAVERARLYTEARKQVETLETLNQLSLSVTATLSVDETLRSGMVQMAKLLDALSAVVYLYNEKSRSLEIASMYNIEGSLRQLLEKHNVLPVYAEYDRVVAAIKAFLSHRPFVVSNMTAPSYINAWEPYLKEASGLRADESMRESRARSLVAFPLLVRDRTVGAITVYFADVHEPSEAELRLFQNFANILALAVYNTQLLAQTGKLATVEERARLARELHDSVTQSLFSLNLTLKAARRNMEISPEKAEKLLDNVQELAQGALAEMRALIFELRPQALANEGLASALQKHSDSVRARSGLAVHLDITGDRRLPLDVEEALYQIAREALHNVVKHAQATDAWVRLHLDGPEVLLSIRDNGRGFDPDALLSDGGSHIGTSTMRERADALGGHIEITSAPGQGTEVAVTAHLDGERKTKNAELKEGAIALQA